ncbi:MAG: hypothetical protein NTU48_00270 [Legionellales bacterium]|nr:hypothetical protein [Legionellales bacterium]
MAITVATTATLAGLLFSATQACEWYQTLFHTEDNAPESLSGVSFSLS